MKLPRPNLADTTNRPAAFVAIASAGVLVAGSFLRWATVKFDGVMIAELSPSGWAAGDGKVIVLVAAGAVVVAALLFAGRHERWLKYALLGAGALTIAIAVFNDLDDNAGSKPRDIADSLGLTAQGITSQSGTGLQLVLLGGVGLVAAGMLVRRPPKVSRGSPGSPTEAHGAATVP